MHSPEADSWFAFCTQKGQELETALKRGGPIPEEFANGILSKSGGLELLARFSGLIIPLANLEACAFCRKEIAPPAQVMRCSGCKAVIYCSPSVRP